MTAALYLEIYSLASLLTVSIVFLFFVCFCVRILHFLELLLSCSFFFHAYLTIIIILIMTIIKQRKITVSKRPVPRRAIILRDKHPGFCSYSSRGHLSRSFLGSPFLKRPHKLQKGVNWALIGQFLK